MTLNWRLIDRKWQEWKQNHRFIILTLKFGIVHCLLCSMEQTVTQHVASNAQLVVPQVRPNKRCKTSCIQWKVHGLFSNFIRSHPRQDLVSFISRKKVIIKLFIRNPWMWFVFFISWKKRQFHTNSEKLEWTKPPPTVICKSNICTHMNSCEGVNGLISGCSHTYTYQNKFTELFHRTKWTE